jgi:hypothetical protein
MNPVKGHTMLNFIHWLKNNKPQIRKLSELSVNDLFLLVNEYEQGKLEDNEILEHKWRNGFLTLFHESKYGLNDYQEARDELKSYEKGKINFDSDRFVKEFDKFHVNRKSNYQKMRYDILERSREIPLHAIFLYTTEDQEIHEYITNNWGAIDSISGQYCDVYPSLDQFNLEEDAYDQINNLKVLKDFKFSRVNELPGLFFWDNNNNSVYIQFRNYPIKTVVRTIFGNIRYDPSILSVKKAKKSLYPNYEQNKIILILSSDPKDTARLRLGEEVREIEEGLQRSEYRDQFTIQSKWAVRLRDIRRAMLDVKPQIVHFCGHGDVDGLMIEDETGTAILVNPEALAGLFELFKDTVECVLLNACYSVLQASAINVHIRYVIGMSKKITDKAALEFAIGFYDALGAGRTAEEAFKFGRNAIQFYNIPEHLTPILLGSTGTVHVSV